jgi:hypothetical protein
MTQADNATALRRSLDSEPTQGQGPAATPCKITAKTPLPKGWASFCSKPDSSNRARWYATAPWDLISITEEYGPNARYLAQTVDADTWADLHKAVRAQVRLYQEVTSSSPEE